MKTSTKDKRTPEDWARIKAIMSKPIKPQSTHAYYFIEKIKQEQRQPGMR